MENHPPQQQPPNPNTPPPSPATPLYHHHPPRPTITDTTPQTPPTAMNQTNITPSLIRRVKLPAIRPPPATPLFHYPPSHASPRPTIAESPPPTAMYQQDITTTSNSQSISFQPPPPTPLRQEKLPVVRPALYHPPPRPTFVNQAISVLSTTQPSPNNNKSTDLIPDKSQPPLTLDLNLLPVDSPIHPFDAPQPSRSLIIYQNTPKSSDLISDKPRAPLTLDLNLPPIDSPIDAVSTGDQFLVDVALSRRWDKWSVEALLPRISINTDPSYLCFLHSLLMKTNIEPVDDICVTLPCTLIQNKRMNALKGFVMYCKRQLESESGKAVRKVAGTDSKWKDRDGSQIIAGENDDEEAGTCFKLLLMYAGGVRSAWHAWECVCSQSMGDTSVVYLTPHKLEDPIKLEGEVRKHESKVKRCRQNCTDAKYEKKKNTLSPHAANTALVDAQKLLGQAILNLDSNRELCKNIEDKLSVGSSGAVAGGPSDASSVAEKKFKADVISGRAKVIQEGGSGSAAAGRVVRHNLLMSKLKEKKLKGKNGNQNPQD